TAAAEIAFVARTSKVTGKTPRGLVETIYADTGFISQNIYLFCASEDLGTVVRAMVPKDTLAQALGLAPDQEITLVQTVGWK
nr:nitroreductase family protein [Bacteroidales bacterium]